MERIIGGRFGTKAEADVAARRIFEYIEADDVCIFHNNPPGQHGVYAIGGDEKADPGAKGAETPSVATAAVAGAVAGAAAVVAGPVAALAAAGVAAYTGSLVGALGGLGEPDDKVVQEPVQALRRQGGIILAVHVVDPADELRVIEDLSSHGAKDVERADGEWRDGDWVDFDPLATPRLVHNEMSSHR